MVVNILKHDRFERKGNNLILEKDILLSEALCGVKFVISHLDGREILFKTDEIIHPDQEYYVREEGLPIDDFNSGDIILNFNITFPDLLDNERKLYLKKILPVSTNKVLNENIETKNIENYGEKIDMEEVNLEGNTQENNISLNTNINMFIK